MIDALFTSPSQPAPNPRETALREQARKLESLLFAELLRASGAGNPSPAGAGETQFDSFLREAQAEAVAKSGQTGLADAIYRSMSTAYQEQRGS